MNENVIKAINAIDDAIAVEAAKIQKMNKMKEEFIDKYHFQCRACKCNYKLNSYTYRQSHYVDMDSDWYRSNVPEWDRLKCPGCNKENDVRGEELIRMIKMAKFAKTEAFEGGKGR